MPEPLTILGVAGAAAYIGKKSADVVAELVREMLMPAARAAGQGLSSPVQAWAERKVHRAQQTVIEAAMVLEQDGKQARAVPGRVLWPLLEHASNEEDDELHQLWVALLARAGDAASREIPPAFVEVLRGLSPVEAKILQRVYNAARKNQAARKNRALYLTGQRFSLHFVAEEFGLDGRQQQVIIGNLQRLQILEPKPPAFDTEELAKTVALTTMRRSAKRTLEADAQRHGYPTISAFGTAFILSCMERNNIDDDV